MPFRPQYLSSPPTLTSGQFNSGLLDAAGNLMVSVASMAAGDPALAAAIGSPADEAWAGSGNGTVIALLKAIALNTEAP